MTGGGFALGDSGIAQAVDSRMRRMRDVVAVALVCPTSRLC